LHQVLADEALAAQALFDRRLAGGLAEEGSEGAANTGLGSHGACDWAAVVPHQHATRLFHDFSGGAEPLDSGERGAQRLFVLPTGYACALEEPPRGVIACALHALTLLIARQLLHELHGLESTIEYFVVPPLCPLRGSPCDFSRTNELIKRAAESTCTWLAEGGLTRCCEIPQQMHPHNHHRLLELSDRRVSIPEHSFCKLPNLPPIGLFDLR
jgi:hypothetical protein